MFQTENNKLEQNLLNAFELENSSLKKQNEIFNLESIHRSIIKIKSGEILNELTINNHGEFSKSQFNISDAQNDKNSEEDILLFKLLHEELELFRGKYQKATKFVIAEKKNITNNLKRKEKLLSQIDELKKPKFPQIEIDCETSPARITRKTTNLSSFNNVEDDKHNKMIEELNKELDKAVSTLHFLKNELEEETKRKKKFEKDIVNLSTYLSDKFSIIFKLEIRLDKSKIKNKQKNFVRNNEKDV